MSLRKVVQILRNYVSESPLERAQVCLQIQSRIALVHSVNLCQSTVFRLVLSAAKPKLALQSSLNASHQLTFRARKV